MVFIPPEGLALHPTLSSRVGGSELLSSSILNPALFGSY